MRRVPLTADRSHHSCSHPFPFLDAVPRPTVTASFGSVSTAAALQPSSNVGVIFSFSCAKKKGARIFGADNQLACVVRITVIARHCCEEDDITRGHNHNGEREGSRT